MPSRHKARQQALQILFQWDVRKHPVGDSIEAFYGPLQIDQETAPQMHDAFADALARGTAEAVSEIDSRITRHAEHWRIERMPAVDRNILRLAIFEMMRMETPAPVVIDEALELARRFSGEESVLFINGVLDAVYRELGSAKAQA
ncbi:MAG: transcription antitermination factor NusB [Acidobacteriota bacterium]|nr:transcription antitermination factor NusB [Acidobacteriota bacterium]